MSMTEKKNTRSPSPRKEKAAPSGKPVRAATVHAVLPQGGARLAERSTAVRPKTIVLPQLDDRPLHQLLEALEASFLSVDVFIAECDREAASARGEGDDLRASMHEQNAADLRPGTDPAVRTKCFRAVLAVRNLISSGYVGHVNAMTLRLDSRRTREWLNRITSARALWRELQEGQLRDAVRAQTNRSLPWRLSGIDEAARSLSAEDVEAAWNEHSTDARTAAALSSKCGAFGHETFSKAWDVFRKLPPE